MEIRNLELIVAGNIKDENGNVANIISLDYVNTMIAALTQKSKSCGKEVDELIEDFSLQDAFDAVFQSIMKDFATTNGCGEMIENYDEDERLYYSIETYRSYKKTVKLARKLFVRISNFLNLI